MRRVAGLKGDLDTSFGKQSGVGEGGIIGIIFVHRHTQHLADDDRYVLRLQLIGHLMRFDAASDDDFDLHLIGKSDDGANVARQLSINHQRHLAAHDRNETFFSEIRLLLWQATVFSLCILGIGIGSGFAERLFQFFDAPLLFAPRVRNRALLTEAAEAAATTGSRPVELHTSLRL